MTTDAEYTIRIKNQELADLKRREAELEREISDADSELERDLARATARATELGRIRDSRQQTRAGLRREHGAASQRFTSASGRSRKADNAGRHVHATQGRTARLVNYGRSNSYQQGPSRGWVFGTGTVAVALLAAILLLVLPGRGASWPGSVATVQSEIAQACRNPDVMSEPGQVNFACAKGTRQILWVLALMTSGNNPNFIDATTGRRGLEPITPTQGGMLAWSLNLHHPYNPANPIDSLQVAARAINDIVGGATVTGVRGGPVVQAGLEGSPANCARYTGSPAMISRAGFPSVCAKPLTAPQGQAALVADVFRRWVTGAAASAAHDAGVLYANARNPGSPQVQAILKHLPLSRPSST